MSGCDREACASSVLKGREIIRRQSYMGLGYCVLRRSAKNKKLAPRIHVSYGPQ